jgi:serine protease Do
MKLKKTVVALAVAGLVFGAGALTTERYFVDRAQAATAPSMPVVAQPGPMTALPDFSALVAKYGPAVVNISVTETEKATGFSPQPHGLDPNDPFYWFFRQFPAPVPHDYTMRGMGSGFIIRPDGVILTNAHVVDNASEVTVKLVDRREFKAKVLGIDKPSDIGVLKIDASNLPVVKLGDSADIKVGEWVVAIGSPFGFENSATVGIVSAKLRSLGQETYVPFIQTDAAVNPGNSGGPLFDARGEVIGINSQIYTRSGGYQGLSFAIPIGVAMQVEGQLLASGHVTRGRLGVIVQDVNQNLADAFKLPEPSGALVSSVEKGGPASRAGIEPGDIIVKFNDKKVTSSSDLPLLVANTKPGNRVAIDVLRGGSSKQLEVTVGELKSTNLAASKASAEHTGLGLSVRPLTPEEHQDLDVKGGVMVEGSTGPAAMAGIEPGDVILAVNGAKVSNPQQLRTLTAKAGKEFALLVQRENQTMYVPVQIG